MVEDNPEMIKTIAAAGPPSSLVALLRDGSPAAKEYALWSLSLSVNQENVKVIVSEGGIRPLVNALTTHNILVKEQSAAALALVLHPDRAAPDDLVLNQRQRGLSPDQAGRLWCVRQAAEHQAARITSICRSVFTCSGCSGRNRQPCMSR